MTIWDLTPKYTSKGEWSEMPLRTYVMSCIKYDADGVQRQRSIHDSELQVLEKQENCFCLGCLLLLGSIHPASSANFKSAIWRVPLPEKPL